MSYSCLHLHAYYRRPTHYTVVFTYMRNKYADTYLLKWVVTPLISKPTVKPSHLTVDYLVLHVRGRQKAIS